MKIKNKKTKRGFQLTSFKDTHGAECSLQMSSSAMEEKIWLGVNDANPKVMTSDAEKLGLSPKEKNDWMSFPIPSEVLLNTRMHLNRKQVEKLLPYLKRFVKTGNIHKNL